MAYLLDTNHCIYLINSTSKLPYKRTTEEENTLKAVQVLTEPFRISQITVAELYYGAYKSQRVRQNLEALEELKQTVQILPITEDLLRLFGELKADVKKRGKSIENFDLMIGVNAILHGLTLVSNDHVFDLLAPQLKTENWSTAISKP